MEKELPVKFAGLTGEKVQSAEVKLEKREKPDVRSEDRSKQGKDSNHTGNKSEGKEEAKEEKGGILDRIKPRPNNIKSKRVKESTEGVEQPQGEVAEGGDKPKRDPAKTRCNFWPTCKNQDCPFVHPNQQVS